MNGLPGGSSDWIAPAIALGAAGLAGAGRTGSPASNLGLAILPPILGAYAERGITAEDRARKQALQDYLRQRMEARDIQEQSRDIANLMLQSGGWAPGEESQPGARTFQFGQQKVSLIPVLQATREQAIAPFGRIYGKEWASGVATGLFGKPSEWPAQIQAHALAEQARLAEAKQETFAKEIEARGLNRPAESGIPVLGEPGGAARSPELPSREAALYAAATRAGLKPSWQELREMSRAGADPIATLARLRGLQGGDLRFGAQVPLPGGGSISLPPEPVEAPYRHFSEATGVLTEKLPSGEIRRTQVQPPDPRVAQQTQLNDLRITKAKLDQEMQDVEAAMDAGKAVPTAARQRLAAQYRQTIAGLTRAEQLAYGDEDRRSVLQSLIKDAIQRLDRLSKYQPRGEEPPPAPPKTRFDELPPASEYPPRTNERGEVVKPRMKDRRTGGVYESDGAKWRLIGKQ